MKFNKKKNRKTLYSEGSRKSINNKLPYYLKVINHNQFEKLESKYFLDINYDHFIVFCGKGLSYELCNSINQIADISNNLLIGVTNRNEKNLKYLSKKYD